MELEYDPVTSLQHYPLPLSRFGKNPFGDNLYRIVLTSSRRHLVGGQWAGEGNAYHWVPTYRRVEERFRPARPIWVLEGWEPERMTQREWDRTMIDPVSGWLLLGPYPAKGIYELKWEFDKGVQQDNVEKIIGAIEAGRRRSFEDVRGANQAEYQAEEKQMRNDCYDEIKDAPRAFGCRPIASSRMGRGTKTAPILKSAEELGLPVPRQMPHMPNMGPMSVRSSVVTFGRR
jgi:hypothetical protein